MKHCLIVIDMQEGVFCLKRAVFHKDILLQKVNSAIRSARSRGIGVVFFRHENSTFLKKGTDGHQFVDGLDVSSGDIVLEKQRPDIFADTGLDGLMKQAGVTSIIIAGVISNGCIRDGCLSALSRGYHVTLVEDAHSTFYANAADIVLQINKQMAQAGARVIPADELDLI